MGPVTRQPSFALVAFVSLVLAAVAGLSVGALRPSQSTGAPKATTISQAPPSTPTPTPAAAAAAPAITLASDKSRAAAGERINLTGRAQDPGVALQVQERSNGAWVDFPARGTTRADGTFASYVLFGRSGAHVLRMVIPSTGGVSNPITVTVG